MVSLPRDCGPKGGVRRRPAVRNGLKGQSAERLRTEGRGLSEASGPKLSEGSARLASDDQTGGLCDANCPSGAPGGSPRARRLGLPRAWERKTGFALRARTEGKGLPHALKERASFFLRLRTGRRAWPGACRRNGGVPPHACEAIGPGTAARLWTERGGAVPLWKRGCASRGRGCEAHQSRRPASRLFRGVRALRSCAGQRHHLAARIGRPGGGIATPAVHGTARMSRGADGSDGPTGGVKSCGAGASGHRHDEDGRHRTARSRDR